MATVAEIYPGHTSRSITRSAEGLAVGGKDGDNHHAVSGHAPRRASRTSFAACATRSCCLQKEEGVSNRRVRAALLSVWFPACLFAQAPVPPAVARIQWETDYDAALVRADKEKRPLFIAFLMDDEPANDQTIQQHYKDPQVLALLEHFVCLVGCLGEHTGTEPGCAKFPGIECRHHHAIEKKARQRWLVGDLVCTPQHVFCDPQGNVLRRKVYLIPKATLAKCLLMTLADCGIDTKGFKVDFGKEGGDALPESERASVDTWLVDLGSRNLEVREAALRGLGQADDPRALPAVVKCCGPKNDDATRLAAISALGRKGNYQAVEPLAALLKENKAPILGQVARALDAIEMPDAVPPLLKAIKKEKRDRVLGVLLRAAAHSQPANTEVRDICLKVLKNASTQLRSHVVAALGYLDTDDKIVAAVVPILESNNQNMRGIAVWTLGSQRSDASRAALAALQNEEKTPEVQKLLGMAIRRARGEEVENYDTQLSIFLSNYSF